ncbi:MAG TPA: tautomerase family protein [Gammaproteobacteria bacterium]
MPYIDLLVHPGVTAAQAAALTHGITEAMVTIMGKRREVTAVRVAAAGATHWSIGGKSCTGQTAYLEVRITAGTNTTEQKAALLQQLHTLLSEQLGDIAEASYFVIHEIPAENWGYAGLTQAARSGRSL